VQTFPRTGYASLRGQITRAAESIPFNIVEGCGASSQKDFARFLDNSVKSSFELEYQLRLARDYGVLAHTRWQVLSGETIEVRRMLYGLRSKVLASNDIPPAPSPASNCRGPSVTEQPNDSTTENP
jgi:four helix bundle protein